MIFGAASGFDTIADFVSGSDRINLDTITELGGGLAFDAYAEGQVTKSSSFAAAFQVARQLASDGTNRVVFVAGPADGWLFWDTDGVNTTLEAAVRLQGLNTLTAFGHGDLV